jgi:hypothetical protein
MLDKLNWLKLDSLLWFISMIKGKKKMNCQLVVKVLILVLSEK